jgi:hypothetical protein
MHVYEDSAAQAYAIEAGIAYDIIKTGYTIASLTLTDTSGNTLGAIPENGGFMAEMSVTVNSVSDTADYFIIASYSEDGEMLSLGYVRCLPSDTQELSFGVYVPQQDKKIAHVRAFVWDGFGTMKALAPSKEI